MKAYQQCISKGSSLTLSECIKICQMEDATHRQVQTLRPDIKPQPELQDNPTSVHKVNNFYHSWGRSSFRGRGSHRGSRYSTSTWGNHHNSSHTCGNCGNPQHKYRSECKSFKVECYLCHRRGHFAHMCRTYPMQDQNDVKHIDTNEEENPQSEHCEQDYTTPFFLRKEEGIKSTVKSLITTKVHYIHNKDAEHIRPLWLLQSPNSDIAKTECEVDTGAGCNIMPLHKAQQHFSKEWLDALDQPRVHIEAYGGQPIYSLGSCVVYLHIDNKVFPTIFEVTDTPGPIILGRKHAKAMGYVQYPAIKPPDITTRSLLHKVCADTTCNFKPKTDIKNVT